MEKNNAIIIVCLCGGLIAGFLFGTFFGGSVIYPHAYTEGVGDALAYAQCLIDSTMEYESLGDGTVMADLVEVCGNKYINANFYEPG